MPLSPTELWRAFSDAEKSEACLAVWQAQDWMSERAREARLPGPARSPGHRATIVP